MPPRRLALLVATYHYQDDGLRQLTSPGHDAEALSKVLRDPEIAGFHVTTLVNELNHVVGKTIGEFYRNRRRDDLTFLYFTGHGLKDDDGRLYLAMTDTTRDNLRFTALSAEQINDAMDDCLSRQKILVLDCCYSGAFPAGWTSKGDAAVHTLEKFKGKGRVVLTASDATQYSFEGNQIMGQGAPSVFTHYLVEGLATGKGDLDNDGDISLDELYGYVYDRVIEEMPQQRPKKHEAVEGRIVVARNIHWSLPAQLRTAIESPIANQRLTSLDGLADLHRIGNDFVRGEVIRQVRRLTDDDSKEVSAAATGLLKTLPELPPPDKKRPDPAPKDKQPTRTWWQRIRLLLAPSRVARRRLILAAVASLSIIITAVTLIIAIRSKTNLPHVVTTVSIQVANPRGVAVVPDGRHAYVTSSASRTVLVIDTVSNTVISTIPVGDRPWAVAVAPNGHHAYVTSRDSDTVSVIDTASNTVTSTIPVGDSPQGMAVTPDSRHSYVANSAAKTVSVIDTASNTVTSTISVGDKPSAVVIAPDGRHSYVANTDSKTVSVIDTASKSVTFIIPVGDGPHSVAITPDGRYVYVANTFSSTMSVINTARNAVTSVIPVGSGPHGVAITPDGRHAYVANTDLKTVSVIDIASNTIRSTIPVGDSPHGVAITPDGRYAYVANTFSSTVSVIEIGDW